MACQDCTTQLHGTISMRPPSRRWFKASEADPQMRQGCLHADPAMPHTVSFLDMGAMCTASPGEAASCQHVTQLLVPGLEQRAWHLPAFLGVRASPGTS